MISTENQPQDAVARFNELKTTHDFLFVIFFRGHWCPFCMSYLKTLESINKDIESKGGKVLAITSEIASELPNTRTASGYTGEIVVDTQNKLATELKKFGLLDVAISEKKGYEFGMAQPAIFVNRFSEKKVLFQWAIVPSLKNLGGAKDRPDLQQLWENVQSQLKGGETIHKKLKLQTFFGVMYGKIFG